MTINYYIKEVYGQPLYYLEGDYAARLWQNISNRKTITRQDMAALTALTKVEFKQVLPPTPKSIAHDARRARSA